MTESTRADSASSTFLEQTLWQQLRAAEAPEDVVHRWLALQSKYLAGTRCAVVVLGDSGAGPYAPVSSWPDQDAPDPSPAEAPATTAATTKSSASDHASTTASSSTTSSIAVGALLLSCKVAS